ncbi:MAG: DNA polymerase III subunit alpha [Bacilli bacterium]|nr:DNA polymerase III subunit alpha [Bacilli bacterium]
MYAQLYTMTVFSLLNSALRIEEYVEQAKRFNIQALAITDENNVHGLIKFYRACVNANIKPILGMTVLIEHDVPLILLAKTNKGYENLLRLCTEVKLNQDLFDFKFLTEFKEDLLGILPTNNRKYHLYINQLKDILRGDFYLSYFPEFTASIKVNNQKVQELCQSYHLPAVCLQEVRYLTKADASVLRYLQAINKGEVLGTTGFDLFATNQYFLTTEEFRSLFNGYEEAIENTLKIADMCNVTIDFSRFHLPKYPVPENVTSSDYLKAICRVGLEKRLNTKNIPSVYLERLKYELSVIDKMNFSDYFLIVYDFVKFAKQNKIYVGPGRGSSAGSLVSYCLGITNIDPIEYDLLFERFLNPERISMPDIDLDFQDDRRDEVIKYVQSKYGKYHVAHIIAFGTFQSRSALRELGKVMDIQEFRIEQIISLIDPLQSIKENIENSPELQQIINDYKDIKHLFFMAEKIEDIPRNITTHAAGIIICNEDLRGLVGLGLSLDDVYQTQFEMTDLEALGLLKMDFLGIRNLTAISEIVKLIQEIYGVTIDINNIPLDDKKTYRLIARGDTTGIFQLESQGMRQVLQEINVEQFEDIVAVNALYRPGPKDNITLFIRRKKGLEKIEYLHEDLKPILESTYGIIVYQEQIMKIVQKIAGYRLSEADLLRRAIGKKQKAVLEKEKENFVNRALQNGYDRETSETLYDYILKFGDYGFNRSHSVAYALISYQMAYLKANYIVPFMVVLLSQVLGSESQTSLYIKDCKRYGIGILPISINKSNDVYTIENGKDIRISLLAIKGIGKNIAEGLLKERKKGLFTSFPDFVYRTQGIIKQNAFEALVYAGALDEFNLPKSVMINNYHKILDYYRFNPSGYFTDKIELSLDYEEYPASILMKKEKELLGFYLNSHPVRKYINHKQFTGIIPSQSFKHINKEVELLGYLEKVKKLKTKTNENMVVLTISDDMTDIEGVIFPNLYDKLINYVNVDNLYLFKGYIRERNGKAQIILNNLTKIDI